YFFFQAEDGIRDLTVTGVQTCALPIYGVDPDPRFGELPRPGTPAAAGRLGADDLREPRRLQPAAVGCRRAGAPDRLPHDLRQPRSEERRVGKEWRSRW